MTNDATTADLTLTYGSFEATEVEVAATSDAGREFLARHIGAGAVSFTMPRSSLDKFSHAVIGSRLALRTILPSGLVTMSRGTVLTIERESA